MKNYSLLEKREVRLDDNEGMDLKYYLVGNKRSDCAECIDGGKGCSEGEIVYGIKVAKVSPSKEDEVLDEDEVSGITFSMCEAKKLIRILADNTVTPIALAEVVDDWFTSHIYD